MRLLALIVLLSCLCVSKHTIAQNVRTNSGIQDSLSRISSEIWKQKSDSARLAANTAFLNVFNAVLKSDTSMSFPLDSIYGITHVASSDAKMHLYTWNIPLKNGTNKYFGFFRANIENPILIPLESHENNSEDLSNQIISPQNWYGALYYKLIQVKIGDKEAYTLLGWDGYMASSNRKIIDILTIDTKGNIQFGMPVFKTDQGIKSRVVMEYSEKANMLLRYDYQAIKIQKKKKIKREMAWLIVMDRLIPMDPSVKGMRKYYIPIGDIYDGFIFRNGYWSMVEDIDVTNTPAIKK